MKQRDRNKWEIIIERQSTSLVNNYKNLLFVKKKKKKKIIELKQFYNEGYPNCANVNSHVESTLLESKKKYEFRG